MSGPPADAIANDSADTAPDNKPLNIAFLGGGYESAIGRAHRASIELDQRLKLIGGVFSHEPELSQKSAHRYGLQPDASFDDLPHLLKTVGDDLDAIIVLTPQDLHVEHVLACLDAGVPVVCEKALAPSVAEVESIRDKVQSTDGFLAVINNYTGYPMVRELRHMVQSGRLGEIKQIILEMPQEGFAKRDQDGNPITPQTWRLHDGYVPTLSLDLGVHLHMMGLFVTGQEPVEVVAMSGTKGNFPAIVDNVSGLLRFSGGADGTIWYGKTALGHRNGLKIRVTGSEGGAEWVQEVPERLFFADNRGRYEWIDRGSPGITVANQERYERFRVGHPAGFIEAFANYYYDVAEVLKARRSGGTAPGNSADYVFGVEEALSGLKMIEAISRSSSNNQWEAIT